MISYKVPQNQGYIKGNDITSMWITEFMTTQGYGKVPCVVIYHQRLGNFYAKCFVRNADGMCYPYKTERTYFHSFVHVVGYMQKQCWVSKFIPEPPIYLKGRDLNRFLRKHKQYKFKVWGETL